MTNEQRVRHAPLLPAATCFFQCLNCARLCHACVSVTRLCLGYRLPPLAPSYFIFHACLVLKWDTTATVLAFPLLRPPVYLYRSPPDPWKVSFNKISFVITKVNPEYNTPFVPRRVARVIEENNEKSRLEFVPRILSSYVSSRIVVGSFNAPVMKRRLIADR